MDIEYYVEASQAKEQKIVAWGCFARCYFNWATISKGSSCKKTKIGELVSSILKLIFLWSKKLKQLLEKVSLLTKYLLYLQKW